MIPKILKRLKVVMRTPQNIRGNLLLKMKSCDWNKKDRRSGGTFSVKPKIALKGWIVYVVFSLCWQLSDYCVYRGAPWFVGEWFLSAVWIWFHDRQRLADSESFRFLLACWLCGMPGYYVRQNSGSSPLHFTLVRKATFRLSCDESSLEHNTVPTRPPDFFKKDPKRRSLIYRRFRLST